MSLPIPVVIAGPTGVGKSRLALRLAHHLGGEIVNYDSVQIYRGFDLGSAKPTARERAELPHHLFDIREANEHFDAAEYARLARDVTQDILKRERLPILVGGTFFYLRSFLAGLPEMPARDERLRSRLRRILANPRGRGRLHRWLARIDPVSAARIAVNDRHRIERALEVFLLSGTPISFRSSPPASHRDMPHVMLALTVPRQDLYALLDRRVEAMYHAGLVEETRTLLTRFSYQSRPFGSIGYQEAARVLSGQINLEEAVAETKRRSRAYAKRQITWLRSEHNVHWISAAEGPDQAFHAALEILARPSGLIGNP
jgi:tRNA dimethylallyltransferase